MKPHRDLVPSYGTSSRLSEVQAIADKGLSAKQPDAAPRSLSIVVYDSKRLGRTTLGHGLSEHELKRLRNTMHYLKREGVPCLLVVLGDHLLNLPENRARACCQKFASRVVREQRRHGVPQFWLRVNESTAGFHANFIFTAHDGMEKTIRRWREFNPYMVGKKAIQVVVDFEGLSNYLAGERPPNVKGGCSFGARVKGAHPLGQGGGDRVLLSTRLREDVIADGLVEPWKRSKAKVLVTVKSPVVTAVLAVESTSTPDTTALMPIVASTPPRLTLLREVEPDMVAVATFHGGFVSQRLAESFETLRLRTGMDQRKFCHLLGIAQSTYSNITGGLYDVGKDTGNRWRELCLAIAKSDRLLPPPVQIKVKPHRSHTRKNFERNMPLLEWARAA